MAMANKEFWSLGFDCQDFRRARLRVVDGPKELLPHVRIRDQFLLLDDALVICEEFAFQNPEPVEFRKQVSAGAHRVAHRIGGLRGDIAVQQRMGAVEIGVVHARERLIDFRRGAFAHRGRGHPRQAHKHWYQQPAREHL